MVVAPQKKLHPHIDRRLTTLLTRKAWCGKNCRNAAASSGLHGSSNMVPIMELHALKIIKLVFLFLFFFAQYLSFSKHILHLALEGAPSFLCNQNDFEPLKSSITWLKLGINPSKKNNFARRKH